jgi:DNA repair exonuclease SbcCD ATPase subunit
VSVAATQNPAPVTREVFLTPRVIDQGAFEELSGSLKSLVREAATEAASLRATLDTATRVRADAAEGAGKQRATLELSSKLLKALTARAESVEHTLARIESGREALDRLSLESERMVAARLAAVETGLREAADRIEYRVAQATHAGTRAADGLEGIVSRAERLASTEGGLADVVARGEAATDRLDDAAERLDRIHTDATISTSRLAESLGGSMKLLDGLEARGMTLVRTVETAMARAERTAQDAMDRAAAVRTLADDLQTITNTARTEREALSADISRVDRAAQRVENVLTAARETMRDLELWRPILEGETVAANTLPPALRAIADRFRCELGQDLARMASAMQSVADRVEPSVRSPHQMPGPEVVVRAAAG